MFLAGIFLIPEEFITVYEKRLKTFTLPSFKVVCNTFLFSYMSKLGNKRISDYKKFFFFFSRCVLKVVELLISAAFCREINRPNGSLTA